MNHILNYLLHFFYLNHQDSFHNKNFLILADMGRMLDSGRVFFRLTQQPIFISSLLFPLSNRPPKLSRFRPLVEQMSSIVLLLQSFRAIDRLIGSSWNLSITFCTVLPVRHILPIPKMSQNAQS